MPMDLIIPARNEAANISALAEALEPLFASGVVCKAVLIDNGSTDDTAQIALHHGFIVIHEGMRGYGAACLSGMRGLREWHRGHEGPQPPEEGVLGVLPGVPGVVGFLDADLADDPRKLVELLSEVERGADLVIGSRRKLRQPGSMTFTQRFGNGLACLLMRWTTGHAYTDLGPMRVIRWEALEKLDMADRTWGWTVEMQFKAVTRGLKVVEIDVPYRPRHAGKSQISGTIVGSIRAGRKILSTIAVLWWKERVVGRQSTVVRHAGSDD